MISLRLLAYEHHSGGVRAWKRPPQKWIDGELDKEKAKNVRPLLDLGTETGSHGELVTGAAQCFMDGS